MSHLLSVSRSTRPSTKPMRLAICMACRFTYGRMTVEGRRLELDPTGDDYGNMNTRARLTTYRAIIAPRRTYLINHTLKGVFCPVHVDHAPGGDAR